MHGPLMVPFFARDYDGQESGPPIDLTPGASQMVIHLGPDRSLEIVRGDITQEATSAIVNAANQELLVGGGVCGAIHRAGGPAIAEECRRIVRQRGPLATGDAVATTGGNLRARYVIHTPGPVYHGGTHGEPEALARCYRESIRVADELGLESIAFPSISTGIFGYPVQLAAPLALTATREALLAARRLRLVRFVLYDEPTHQAFQDAARVET